MIILYRVIYVKEIYVFNFYEINFVYNLPNYMNIYIYKENF